MRKIKDKLGIDELDDNIRIARYFNNERLKDLIETQKIWYANSDTFVDVHERKIPKSFFKNWPKDSEKRYCEYYDLFTKGIKAYISCWTRFDSENYALWKIYDPESKGACLVTTVGKFKKAIKRQDMFMCKVKYIDLNDSIKIDLPCIQYEGEEVPHTIRATECYKIKAYKYEQEIRSIIYSKSIKRGLKEEVDLASIIDEIYISPFSNEKQTKETLELLCSRFDKSIIKYSDIIERK